MVTENRILRLIEDHGLSPPEAVDYVAVEEGAYSQTEWADARGISQQAVSKNVAAARAKLEEDDGE